MPQEETYRRLFGWIGLTCLLLIIPIKVIRYAGGVDTLSTMIGIAPSLLGPAGLLFLILSGSGKLARLPLLQIAILAAVVALGLEFVQLLPRPGILDSAHYTFDWLDVIASVASVCAGYLVAHLIINRKSP